MAGSDTGARRRAVITGTGAITPLGLTAGDTWQAMVAGRSGIDTVRCIESDDLPTNLAGEVRGFEPKEHLAHKQLRRMDPFAQYAHVAATEAIKDSGLTIDPDDSSRVGVLIGSGYGPMNSIADQVTKLNAKGPRAVSPFAPVTGSIDSAAAEISLEYGITGATRAISSACASGTDAIGEAMRWIRHGMLDVVIVGGAENILTRMDFAGSGNAKALSTRTDAPTEACRPFDADRDGFVMSAGSGVVVLEAEEHARARGAAVLAEVLGYASTSDAHHSTAPHPEGRGVRAAMRNALLDSGLAPTDVDYVNAHGTSTVLNDQAELDSMRAVFGEHVERVPISSTKSMTGHMIGAAGAVEAIAGCQAIATGVVPPTINCHRPIDPSVNFVAHEAQEHDVDVVMSNSFGFGGHNAVLVLRRYES